MRITNNMIVGNTKTNINGNKISVDKYNTQMTTQKKINKASEDPVIAIRSLRLSTSLSHLDQYVDKNIPDADAWMDVTETALNNMKKILTDIRTQCVKGSSDTLTAEDRKTIQNALASLSEQVYTEGNADYAGRTVFTGYRTTSQLTFGCDDTKISYDIDQKFSYEDIEEKRYYTNGVTVPGFIDNTTQDCNVEVEEKSHDRIRLAYGDVTSGSATVSYSVTDKATGEVTTTRLNPTYYQYEDDWTSKEIGDNEVIFLADSGELVLGKNIASQLRSSHADISISYNKTGFDKGDVRPEFYYDCRDITDPANVIDYKKEDQTLDYNIANGITLTVNTQASEVFDTSIARDVSELMSIVQNAINANDNVERIKNMMSQEQYSSEEDQAKLETYLKAAQREADYADDNLQKTYGNYISNFDGYLARVNSGITNVGSMQDRLELTKNRVENQQETINQLKSSNEDRDISDIIIDYYASYNAYQASLTAASKVGSQTLLNYL